MKYDQHFLIDKEIINLIDTNLGFVSGKEVVEIGAGKGAITSLIKNKAKKLTVIEIDEKLITKLDREGITIILGDAVNKIRHIKHDCIVSNLPYGITEPLFKKLLRDPKEMLLLLGRHFGTLLELETKLGMAIKSAWEIKIIREVDKESFDPKPNTKSLLIKFTPKNNFSPEVILFNQHDKKVKNAVINYYTKKGLTKNEAKEKIEKIPKKLLEENMDKLSTQGFKKVLELI